MTGRGEVVEIHFGGGCVSRVPLDLLAEQSGRTVAAVRRELAEAERAGYLARRADGGFDAAIPGSAA